MAKFCGNCGCQLDDNDKVCGNCGMQLDVGSKSIGGLPYIDPQKKASVIKKIKLGVSVVAVVVVIAIIFNIVSSFTGYNGLIRKTMTAYEKYDIDTLISLSSDFYYYTPEEYAEDYFERKVNDSLDYFETFVGQNYKITYEVNDVYTMPERKQNALMKDISDYYQEFDVGLIDDVAVANLTVTAKHGNRSTSQNMQITMTKENDEWKILYID